MNDWSKRRRLEATIAGQQSDRPPVALWRHWPGDDQSAASQAAAHVKWQMDYDWDFVKVSPASSFAVEGWGAASRWVGAIEGTRQYDTRVVQQPSDWERIRPLQPDQGALAVQLEALRLIRASVGYAVPVIATVFSPLAQAKNLAGDSRLLIHLRSHSDQVHRALESISDTTLRYIEAARGSGIDGIFYAVQHGQHSLLSREEFRLFAKAYDLPILSAVSDLWLNLLHVHGTDIMFEEMANYPVQIVNWHDRESGFSLAKGLELIPGAASGGVSRWSLHQESPQATMEESADAIAQNSSRLVLGTGCVCMVTTPTRNIRSLRAAVGS